MTHAWKKTRAKGRRHAALIERLPHLREALYGRDLEAARKYEQVSHSPDERVATRETAQKENDNG